MKAKHTALKNIISVAAINSETETLFNLNSVLKLNIKISDQRKSKFNYIAKNLTFQIQDSNDYINKRYNQYYIQNQKINFLTITGEEWKYI